MSSIAVRPDITPAQPDVALNADALLAMAPVQLDALFQNRPPGETPRGRGAGTIVALPGSAFAKPIARILGWLCWRGKIFRPGSQDLKNLITPFALPVFRAEVGPDDSWLDGRPCVLLDYSRGSKLVAWIRDEIREVSPGVYLGLVWGVGRVLGGRKLVLRFVLTFPPGFDR